MASLICSEMFTVLERETEIAGNIYPKGTKLVILPNVAASQVILPGGETLDTELAALADRITALEQNNSAGE